MQQILTPNASNNIQQMNIFAKLIGLQHNDISAILWGHSSIVFHVRLAPLGNL